MRVFKIVKRILSIIITVVLLFVIVINVLSYFNYSFFGLRVYRIGSGSMEPYLKVNDLIFIKRSDDYKIDDVITYFDGNNYITHRIISINENEIITKGDANNKEDNPITKDKIIGKVIYDFKGFKFINYILLKPLSWVLIFITGILILFLIPDRK